MIHEIIQTLLYSWVLLFGFVGIMLVFFLNISTLVKINIILIYALNKIGIKLKYILNLCIFNIIFLNKHSIKVFFTSINNINYFLGEVKINEGTWALITFIFFAGTVFLALNFNKLIDWNARNDYSK